uniref:RING-type domain-containing protein n=1 Tax=Knipowitschia caucasica TaxID=637954 RepID=A0AAV2J0P2_KNICA
MGSTWSRRRSLDLDSQTRSRARGEASAKSERSGPRSPRRFSSLMSLMLKSSPLPGVLSRSAHSPYVRRVSWIREIQRLLREQRPERAAGVLQLLRKDLGLEGTSLTDVLYKKAAYLNLVDPLSHELLLRLSRDLQCPKPEGSFKSTNKTCRQLLYHLSPHSKWTRPSESRRKSQTCLKSALKRRASGDVLNLSGIPLSPRDVQKVALFLQSSLSLSAVDLSFTALQDHSLLLLLPALGALPQLTVLALNGNRLTSSVLQTLAEALKDLSRFPSLAWVDLGNNVDIHMVPQPLLVALRRRFDLRSRLPTIHECREMHCFSGSTPSSQTSVEEARLYQEEPNLYQEQPSLYQEDQGVEEEEEDQLEIRVWGLQHQHPEQTRAQTHRQLDPEESSESRCHGPRPVAAMKAGASSMWASCCGLLNEVMGTGAVRTPQPAFGAGAGPFRFAPSAGYSTYPPPSSGSAAQLCKACGLAFSVFRRKHVCSDCQKSFCALCSVLTENLRCCSTCHLLRSTAFQRARLMQLRVKDLRQYLLLRNIPTDTCREKDDLVDLVLVHQVHQVQQGHQVHQGTSDSPSAVTEQEEEEEDQEEEDQEEPEEEEEEDSLQASPPSATRSPSQLSVLSFQGDALSPSDSSSSQEPDPEEATTASLLNLDPTENLMEVSPASQRRTRASLSDLDTEDAIQNLSVRQLKEILARNFVNYSGCCEKWELLERVHRLYRENEHNRRSMENVSITADTVVSQLSLDENLCRICMDAIIDCVLLECGHMVTCTKCGKRMSECPICRQYVVRAVHVFKS